MELSSSSLIIAVRDMGYLEKNKRKKQRLPAGQAQNLLKEEIVQLQKQLDGQTVTRSTLEKAMHHRSLMQDLSHKFITQQAEDLIKEISILEMEIAYLEKYLLSMYRKAFAKTLSALSIVDERPKINSSKSKLTLSEVPGADLASADGGSVTRKSEPPDSVDSLSRKPDGISFSFSRKCDETAGAEALDDTGIYRSNSSLSHTFRSSPPPGAIAEAVDSYHSLPLSMLEAQGSSISSGAPLGSSFSKCARENPNWLSEEMIKCVSTMYCQLANPPVFNNDLASPNCFSSPSTSPMHDQHDMLSLSCGDNSSFNSWLDNPLHIKAPNELICSSFTMIEVRDIHRDSQSLNTVKSLLQDFRSLISRLAEVDPGKLKHEAKLAFWINVHNTLVMHAFLVYGIPQNNLKRTSLILKAAYNVGGRTISVDMIQNSILGCRLPRPTQWLQSLFYPKTKSKVGDSRSLYAIDQPEPRLHFALCSGCQSDPSVRLYTPNKLFQELEMAKEEYIQTNIHLRREQKLLMPKRVETFVKEMGLSSAGIAEMIEHSMPDSLRKSFKQPRHGKLWKKLEWIPHNFTFHYLLSDELVK